MAKAAQSHNVVASRYVGALIDLAEDSKKLKDVEKDFSDLVGMASSSADFRQLIHSPVTSESQQFDAIDAIAKKARFTTITTNFLKVLVQNRRLNILESVLSVFQREVSKRRGEIIVTVETAQDLTAAQMKSLQDTLKKETGADVVLNTKVEPSILGGMIVTVGSHMIDDSVARKLERLKTSMTGGANENTNLKEVS
ncbi:MAG: F0F1 ATP synthase subunit delta [Alphaproteobacteria bacterium]|nr:F0F1 ATP synthase subunit delta [Alphaproteobacteria bacterium]